MQQTHSEWVVWVMRERIAHAQRVHAYAKRWPSPGAWSDWSRAMWAVKAWKPHVHALISL